MKLGPAVLLVAAVVAALPATALSARPSGSTCAAGAQRTVGTPRDAYAAVVKSRATVLRAPGGKVLATFDRLNQNGYPTTFSIVGAVLTKGCAAEWYRVQVPLRPNGTVGYVRPAKVTVQKVVTRIEIDVSDRRLVFFRNGRQVLQTKVAVGTSATPTPLGRFYVDQRITTTDPKGPFGPAALGVSAYSDVLTGWTQGGPIGIHGTNKPWLLGQAVSNGCIRVENTVLRRIFAATWGGTPVLIRA